MPDLYTELLETWCESLLKLQVSDIGMGGLHGGILCPSCSRIHGRSMDAIYPFMRMAHARDSDVYLGAAMRLFDWSKHVSCPDGAWICETSSDWKGITVFGAIQLGEALRWHGAILEPAVRSAWLERFRAAADYLHDNILMSTGNINYPITCSSAMAVAWKLLDERRYLLKGRELAHEAMRYFSENSLIFGEGSPQTGTTRRGCRPVDLGYNVEESLPGLVNYCLLTGDEEVLDQVAEGMRQQLEFMLPDGAWDNSWGSRSFKWSYWGSRTSDGCQGAYELLRDRDPAFGEAALRNAELLRECTHEGILYGGPRYFARGYLPCIHHTLFHSKAMATVLDHRQGEEEGRPRVSLPRESSSGAREYQEINTWLVSKGGWRATVCAYDWEYMKEGHPSGGSISMLWHELSGCLFAGSLTEYRMEEENNMQLPADEHHRCITPRLEYREAGSLYRSVNDIDAELRCSEGADAIGFVVEGRLVDGNHAGPGSGELRFRMRYVFSEDSLEISAECPSAPRPGEILLHLPIVSASGEGVEGTGAGRLVIRKERSSVLVDGSSVFEVPASTGEARVFNLVPGLEAIPHFVRLSQEGRARLSIRVEPAAKA